MPVMELIVLIAEKPSAPPCFAARATGRMSVMLGVSFTSTGVRATSFTHSVIIEQYCGNLADGAAHAAFTHAVRTAEIQLQSVGSRAFGSFDDFVPRFAIGIDHQRRDDGVIRDNAFSPRRSRADWFREGGP